MNFLCSDIEFYWPPVTLGYGVKSLALLYTVGKSINLLYLKM